MKHFLYFILLFTALSSKAQNKVKEAEIITDTRFMNGVNLIGESSARPEVIDTLYPFGKTKMQPVWKMPQWATRYNLKGVKPKIKKDTVIYENDGKKVSFFKAKNRTLIGLEVFGSNEYVKPRVPNQEWPHLLLEQRTNQMPIAQMRKLNYKISAKLMYSDNLTGTSYDPGLHAAQVTLYLLVQNVNKASSGLGDYFWFGLPLYDSRNKALEEYAAQDLGKEDATKKFILNVASNELFSGSLHQKQWIHIEKDIYPLLIKAFNTAKANGYLKTTSVDDIAIESTNVGWEIPGTFNAGIQFQNLKLTAELK
ncbi:MAG: hypothetical protein EOO88_08545 [Pedobacter sp.]|nr:MAG: hypothetical protein EOO88_08545 [Pedobacter sp.]